MAVVGVVGAGVIGHGVAQAIAQAGHDVVLVDVDSEALRRAREQIRHGLMLTTLLARNGGADIEEVLGKIVFTTAYDALRDASFVVENVTEDLATKHDALRSVAHTCRDDVVVGCNTSAIPIAVLATATRHPDRVVGMHFMNPVPLKGTVEVIRSEHTSEATLEAALAFLSSIGKNAVVVRDSPGFVANRVLMLTINEASRVVGEDVASAEDVDRIFRECLGHSMGPLETADLIGLDTVVRSLDVLHTHLGDHRFDASPTLAELVAAGKLGRKTGAGFFRYVVDDGA